jgi:hypothetical protein
MSKRNRTKGSETAAQKKLFFVPPMQHRELQEAFFVAVGEHSDATIELRDDVFYPLVAGSTGTVTEVHRLGEALLGWADTSHLYHRSLLPYTTAMWTVVAAWETMMKWKASPEHLERLSWTPAQGYSQADGDKFTAITGMKIDLIHEPCPAPDAPAHAYPVKTWDWRTESRSDYIDDQKDMLAVVLNEQIDGDLARYGLQEAPRKRCQRHFEWLVYHLIHRWSHSRIANEYGVDPKGIGAAIATTAELLCGQRWRCWCLPSNTERSNSVTDD